MSQAKKIYESLAQTDNAAADRSLMLALDMLEEPYQTTALETLLDRGTAFGTGELVGRYHDFSPERKKLLHKRVDDLINGLFRAAEMEQPQARLNVLAIIRKTKYYRLAEIIPLLLRDPVLEISNMAAVVILEMASHFCELNIHAPERLSNCNGGKSDDKDYYLTAMKDAISRHEQNVRREVVLAAMMVVPADRATFWGDSLGPYHAVGEIARDIIKHSPDPELACFCLTATKNSYLRSAVWRAISQSKDIGFIVAMATTFIHVQDDQITDSLGRIKNVKWLDPEIISFEKLNPTQQKAFIEFVSHLNLDPQVVGNYYATFIDDLEYKTIELIIEYLLLRPGEAGIVPLTKILSCSYEQLAKTALMQLIRLQPKNLSEIIAEQLNSYHEAPRKVAQKYFQKIAFQRYWNSFNMMNDSQKIKSGQAVFKIDPDASARLNTCIMKSDPLDRLKAIKIIRILGRASQHVENLKQCLADHDPFVRSSAIASLGDLKELLTPALEKYISAMLRDSDLRVRANAVDALNTSQSPEIARQVLPLIHSRHSRLRANAIKALHNIKSQSTKGVIRQMLCDPRPGHRRSAIWLGQYLADAVEKNNTQAMESDYVESAVPL